MNVKIKFRESFRPFAPSVLEERVAALEAHVAGLLASIDLAAAELVPEPE